MSSKYRKVYGCELFYSGFWGSLEVKRVKIALFVKNGGQNLQIWSDILYYSYHKNKTVSFCGIGADHAHIKDP